LLAAKGGLKMKESPLDVEADTSEGGKGAVNVTASGNRGGARSQLRDGVLLLDGNNTGSRAKKLTMANLADTLARFVDRPVVDMTEIKGNYDFALEFSPRISAPC